MLQAYTNILQAYPRIYLVTKTWLLPYRHVLNLGPKLCVWHTSLFDIHHNLNYNQ